VAIIDIHVLRAGTTAGFFPRGWRLPKDYARFEAAFLAVARHGDVRPSVLDSCIWGTLSRLGRHAAAIIGDSHPAPAQLAESVA
jgi:hypothetical protein